MNPEQAHQLLARIARGDISPTDAMTQWTLGGESNLGYARVDLDRAARCGFPEAIFCRGKTSEQVIGILKALGDAGQNGLATRAAPALARRVLEALPDALYHPVARCITRDVAPLPERRGRVAVISAGTTDLPVAEEAALTAERLGAHVDRIPDVGVAGLHRLMPHLPTLRAARVLIVVAGMEGALASVLGGLVARPLIAVPTRVGYGASFGGLAALLAMLNSCAAGVTVVNIGNGFGAGVAAARINQCGNETE